MSGPCWGARTCEIFTQPLPLQIQVVTMGTGVPGHGLVGTQATSG